MSVIADLIRAGVDPDLVERVHQEILDATCRHAQSALVDEAAERRRANDRNRKRVARSADIPQMSADSADKEGANSSPEVSPEEYISNPLPTPSFPPKKLEKPKPSVLSKKPVPTKTEISETEQPTAKDLQFAEAAGLDRQAIREEWAQYRDHHRKLGNRMADWAAAWRTWVRKSKKINQPRAGPPATNGRPFQGPITAYSRPSMRDHIQKFEREATEGWERVRLMEIENERLKKEDQANG